MASRLYKEGVTRPWTRHIQPCHYILTDNWVSWSALRSAGDRCPEMHHGRVTIRLVYSMTILMLCEVYPLRSLTIEFMERKLKLSTQIQIPNVPAAWLHWVQSKALFGDTGWSRRTPELQCRICYQTRSRVSLGDFQLHNWMGQSTSESTPNQVYQSTWHSTTLYEISHRLSSDI